MDKKEFEKVNLRDRDFLSPRHFMTSMAVSGQKAEIAIMVYAKEPNSNKCNTIYGDILVGDLRWPTKEELNFINQASGCLALTKEELEDLKDPSYCH